MSDYKHTLNLPKTKFAMKANLSSREPEMIENWRKNRAVDAMTAASGARGSYVLHDGPPYANGHIHMGTALNKILKDIVLKSRNMQGYACRYVPGWDCHGLPIEHKVEQDLKGRRKDLPALTVRRLCRDYAAKWIDIQRNEFIRLGVLGDWEHPYLSMDPAYEAATASSLADFVAKGSVMRAKKPIYWCCSCHTALAEAEVEYGDEASPSTYVAFPLPDPRLREIFSSAAPERAHVAIWTTTPWTLPDNEAVCLHPDFEYALVEAGGKQYLLAAGRIEACASLFGWDKPVELGRVKGAELERLVARHPFYDRDSLLILGGHVSLDSGTGCVHTAPGHGREDYEVGQKYGLDALSPLDDSGRFLPNVEFFGGKTVWEANPEVIAILQKNGALLQSGKLEHSYPHCWRCKEPVIFRATTQWFISMEANDLRKRALEVIDGDVRWVPAWGRDRIYNMIEMRPDWCISRQRQWGVPILALKCGHCGEAWNDPAWMREICSRIAAHPTGCDYWYEKSVEELAPPGLKCPHCGAASWEKETDILDVWFDSGTSFSAVLEARPELRFPADLYLEGSDQHRGWFHSSLLISMGTHNEPPYKCVLTHGYVVDAQGHKMSKSVGNVIAPQELIDKFGAELLRLWTSSVYYQEDVPISEVILNRLVDAYRRIRNTCRFILGNICDLEGADLVDAGDLEPLDRFALDRGAHWYAQMQEAYMNFEFHRVFHGLHNYCVTDLSAGYLDIIKDRLYTTGRGSGERRSAQTALWHILELLLRTMAPVLSFTAEEIFQILQPSLKGSESTVFALQAVDTEKLKISDGERDNWNFLMAVRDAVKKALEPLRRDGIIGLSLDARITLYLADDARERLLDLKTELADICMVSELDLAPYEQAPEAFLEDVETPGVRIVAEKARGEKCARCWRYSENLGSDTRWPDICPKCAAVMSGLENGGKA